MNLPIKIAALSYESMSGRVHARRIGVNATITTGLSHLELSLAESQGESDPKELVVLDFTHFLSAVDESKVPFYEASAAVKAFLDVDRSVYSLDANPEPFLDHALSLLLPMTANKLRSICFELGVNPIPKVSLHPVRSAKVAEATAESE